MPMYDYKCPTCAHGREVMLKLDDLNSLVPCQRCGSAMNRQLSAPWVRGDFEPYESPVVPGKWIQGRRQHEEHLKETGCRLYEPGERQQRVERIKMQEKVLDRKVEHTVDEFVSNLPTDKRDQLAAELEGGKDVKIERITPTRV